MTLSRSAPKDTEHAKLRCLTLQHLIQVTRVLGSWGRFEVSYQATHLWQLMRLANSFTDSMLMETACLIAEAKTLITTD